MKAAVTLTLTASLLASSLPAAAQFPYRPPPRYQQPPPNTPPQFVPVTFTSDWRRVRAIEPRSRIRVSAVGLGDRDHQYFVSASDRTITLLVVGHLSRTAKRLVLELAGSHPDLFTVPEKWMEFADGRVRVNPDGVFDGRRKVADLSDIAKTVNADDVAEVAAEEIVQRPRSRDLEPLGPAVAGTFVAALYGTLVLCKDRCGSAAILPILGLPILVGALVARKTPREMQVVYRVR